MNDRDAEAAVGREWAMTLNEWDDKPLICYKCHQTYWESGNLGKWKCIQQCHAYDRRTGECYVYLIKADHALLPNKQYTPLDDITIAKNVFDSDRMRKYFNGVQGRMNIPTNHRAARRRDGFNLNANYVIRRYDWQAKDIVENTVPIISNEIIIKDSPVITQFGSVKLMIRRNN